MSVLSNPWPARTGLGNPGQISGPPSFVNPRPPDDRPRIQPWPWPDDRSAANPGRPGIPPGENDGAYPVYPDPRASLRTNPFQGGSGYLSAFFKRPGPVY